ncbi:MAG: CDP-glycerol glycerophosphotransferase family protein [Agathobacter sp.]|nr:CDP-glycerol glycerophosphotransferase family protein [Agathobacter sp.]
MKLSVIWLFDDSVDNKETFACLHRELKLQEGSEIIIFADGDIENKYGDSLQGLQYRVLNRGGRSDIECYNAAREYVTGDMVTAVSSGDKFSAGSIRDLKKAVERYDRENVFMLSKIMPDGRIGAFSSVKKFSGLSLVSLEQEYGLFPFYFGGTFVRADYFKKHEFCMESGLESEQEYFLKLCLKKKKVVFLSNSKYFSEQAREGDYTFYNNIYEKQWYEESFDGFWCPFLRKMKEESGHIPYFIQYFVMFTIGSRVSSNWNNRNKHVITEGKEEAVLEAIGRTLQYIDDLVMFNGHRIKESKTADSVKWLFGILKYGKDFTFDRYYISGIPYYGADSIVLNKITNLKTNILFMNYENRILHIDGTIHPILFAMADEIYLTLGGRKYPLEYNGRYSLTKIFGVSVYKNHSFHVKLPMDSFQNGMLYCVAKIKGEEIRITFSYESHFSRMSGAYKNSYWCFGENPMYLSVKENEGIHIKISSPKEKRKQERRLSKEMFMSFNKRAWLFLAVRKAYFILRPIMKRKPIWMYLDKIYKGGDSSEYLYRYAVAQKDGNKHYYLVDKHATDYKRLKKAGYKPLVRGSIKHRLVFLMADMMVISNSTVFAFNNFGLPNSSNVRDLVDFHVCCVQHGMSVQKIAVAQNRLRDNIRLYFCASKYEIENLSKPIYDYVGYDALKLTGVPRYDGLVNDDKKQIMISPTWRMQAAVPVRTSEGEQRDYNPLFKESTYYKVYNALINDPRLIEAAKKYGYRIKYVLHPIVSAQVDDFDKNDYVDVIPAVGDMSYERMFCESSLMVTDFSGIQFDFAYLRKPIVYLHHKDIPQHYEEGTFFYDTMAFGEIAHDNDELINLLCEYMANGCQMKEEYVRRADDFFYYKDRNNCKRIYDIMVEYQDKHILNKES